MLRARSNGWARFALAAVIVLAAAASARAATVQLEGVTMTPPPGWRTSRGATTDGKLGNLLEPTSVADGEESFIIWTEPLQAGDLETTARYLQKQMEEKRPTSSAVEKLRLFHLGNRPGIRAELIGTDPWGGEPARVVYWVVAKSPTTAIVFRAVLLNSRYAAFAAVLEKFVRSWKFSGSYTGPKVVLSADRPSTPSYDDDVWHEGMATEDSGASGSWESEEIEAGVDVQITEATIPDDPYEAALPIEAGSLRGGFCYGEGYTAEESLQFDGKGQWARHQGAPPEKFSLSGVPPDASGFYKVTGTILLLRAHQGQEIRCTSPRNGILRCSGKEYDRALCR